MKQYIGKKVQFVVDGMGMFKAKVVGDQKQIVVVQGDNDEYPWRLIKNKISAYKPLEKTEDDANLLVLMCENPTIRCPGVKFVK